MSEADIAAEQAIRAIVQDRFPEDGFYGEESAVDRIDARTQQLVDAARRQRRDPNEARHHREGPGLQRDQPEERRQVAVVGEAEFVEELGRHAEILPQPQRGIGGDRALAVDDVADAVGRGPWPVPGFGTVGRGRAFHCHAAGASATATR